MPRRFQPLQIAAALIIGAGAALIILILYLRVWL
jgi:hypothetical protein